MRAMIVAFVLVLSCMGCATARPLASGSTFRVEASGASSEMGDVCDSARARFRRTPVYLADGTPVWCF